MKHKKYLDVSLLKGSLSCFMIPLLSIVFAAPSVIARGHEYNPEEGQYKNSLAI